MSVVRADVAGRVEELVSYGSSEIVDRNGTVLGSAQQLETDLVVANIKTAPREPRPGWNASRNPRSHELTTRARGPDTALSALAKIVSTLAAMTCSCIALPAALRATVPRRSRRR